MTYPKFLVQGMCMALVAMLASACVAPIQAPISAPAAETGVQLLFAYSSTCAACMYEKPIITEFAQKHPEVKVTLVEYSLLNPRQKQLIAGTNGNPTMVFYRGDTIRQISGQLAGAMFEREFTVFQAQLSQLASSKTTVNYGGI
jgi:thiol-disulfide isomerase/thioredoxin